MANSTETVKDMILRTTGRAVRPATAERLIFDDKANRKSELIVKQGRANQIIYNGWVATLSPSGAFWFLILGPYYVEFSNHWEFEKYVDDTDAAITAIINARK